MRPPNISLRQGSCQEYAAAEGSWNQYGGESLGVMRCFVDAKGAAWLQWTNTNLSILSVAKRNDGNQRVLNQWWASERNPQ